MLHIHFSLKTNTRGTLSNKIYTNKGKTDENQGSGESFSGQVIMGIREHLLWLWKEGNDTL